MSVGTAILTRNNNMSMNDGNGPYDESRSTFHFPLVQELSNLALLDNHNTHQGTCNGNTGTSAAGISLDDRQLSFSDNRSMKFFPEAQYLDRKAPNFLPEDSIYSNRQEFDSHPPYDDKFNINGGPIGSTIPRKSSNMTETVPVPSSEHVAEIVGRQGCKIKSLRTQTNTYIKTPVRGSEPVFVVTGRKEDVAHAKHQILSAAEHFSSIRAKRNGSNGLHTNSNSGSSSPTSVPLGHMTSQVRVPYKVVGLVVGPKGATIKRIQQTTSTYIVTPGRDKDPVFEVTGLPENVEKAKEEIEKHIASRTGTDNNSDLQIDDFQPYCVDPGFHEQNNESGQSMPATSTYNTYNNIVNGHDDLPPLCSHLYQHLPHNSLHKNGQCAPPIANSNPNAADYSLLPSFNPFQNEVSSFKGTSPSDYEPDEGIATHGSSAVSIYDPSAVMWGDVSSFDVQRSNSVSVHQHLPPGEDGPHPRTRRTNSDPLAAAFQKIDATFSSSSVGSSQGSTSPVTGRRNNSPSHQPGKPQPPVGTASAKPSPCYSCGGEVNAALVPCAHHIFCMRCAEEICRREPGRRNCPLCHKPAEGALLRAKP